MTTFPIPTQMEPKVSFFFVKLTVLIIRYDVFDQHKEEHHRRRPDDDVRGVALKFVNVFQQNLVSAE